VPTLNYRPRVVDAELRARLTATGAVVIEGPKACGKTATARQVSASEVLLDVDEDARLAASLDPSLVLDGRTPRLIDEWQLEPALWNHIRRTVDERGEPGQFILTGSARPTDDITRHTGAGRITRVAMRPMSLFETGHASGDVSIGKLLRGDAPRCPDPGLRLPDLIERIVIGGWPSLLGRDARASQRWVRAYLDEIRRTDINQLDAVSRDPDRVGRLLRAVARNIATPASAATLARDAGGEEGALARDTVQAYLNALQRLHIVEDQAAWAPHLRSRSVLRSAGKRHLVDPSLAAAALRATPEGLLRDLNLLGFLFESLVVRDLRVYAQASDASVYHYRDNTGLEIDAIVERPDGTWAAFEVELGNAQVDEAAATLKKFADRVDTRRCGKPATLAVITGSGYGYHRPDGVGVVPIGGLGP